jgi:hypothetical protein
LEGIVMPSMNSRCKSSTWTPLSSLSSAIEPTTTISSPSSLSHIGIGVPQKRLRLTAQSRAFSSQLWKRFSCTKPGTQYVFLLFSTSRSLIASTLTKVPGTAR